MKLEDEIILLSTSDLKPYEKNNKIHSETQIEKLALHIENVGWDVPIVVDEDNVILKGHGRLEAAKRLELKEVPCIVRRGLTEAQKKAVRIADNKLAEIAQWDEQALKLELADLAISGFDAIDLGFDELEVKKLIGELEDDDDFEFNASDKSGNDEPKLSLKVTCETQLDQEELFQELNDRGYKVKVC